MKPLRRQGQEHSNSLEDRHDTSGGERSQTRHGSYAREEYQRTEDEGERADKKNDFLDVAEALLVVFICTHGAEITKGKKVAGGYFVTSDTSWRSKEALSRTALRLDFFAEAIAAIKVKSRPLWIRVGDCVWSGHVVSSPYASIVGAT